jgi:hypothetical protein
MGFSALFVYTIHFDTQYTLCTSESHRCVILYRSIYFTGYNRSYRHFSRMS